MRIKGSGWRWFYLLAALEAGAALLMLFLIPHEGGSYSLTRLVMFGALLVLFVIWVYFLIHPPTRMDILVRPSFALASMLLTVFLGWLLFFLRYLDPEKLLPYYQRLAPILFYLLLLSLQFSIFVLVFRYGFKRDILPRLKSTYKPALVAFCILLILLCFVAITRLGVTKDPAYWGEPGVPLLGWQLVVAILIGASVLILGLRFALDRSAWSAIRTDLIFAILIWLGAVWIWLCVPMSVMQNSFYAPMVPPSGQPFPNSDAAYYDYHAQSVLLGLGYLGDIPTRPLYVFLLVLLHGLFGQNYSLIIAGQSCVLALFPVILFFLGKMIHSRVAGVMVAFFAIFRELTMLWVSSATRVSNTRTLLTDLPTALMIALACLFVMRWLQDKGSRRALIAGGVFGAMLLLRTQSVVIFPFVILLAVFIVWSQWRLVGGMITLFVLGVAVTIAPWLTHNYLATGQFAFDDPRQMAVISSQYALSGNLDTSQFNVQSQSLTGNLISFIMKYPGVVAQFITNHFFATEIGGVLALPLIEPFKSLRAPIDIYWFNWDGYLTWYNLLLVVLYLAIIAMGLGSAWKRLSWLGLAPLIFSLGYAIANGISRFSGWRYDFPADWISYFYFGIGIAEILSLTALLFGASDQRLFTRIDTNQHDLKFDPRSAFPVLAGFVLIGALPWIAEHALPSQKPQPPNVVIVEHVSQVPVVQSSQLTQDQLNRFLVDNTSPKAEVLQGWILYPRFYGRGQGIAQAHPSPAYESRDYPRLGFLLMTNQITPIVFPSKQVPMNFPDAGKVIVFGCDRSDYLEARVIVFPEQNLIFEVVSPLIKCESSGG